MISITASPDSFTNIAGLQRLSTRLGISVRDITIHESRMAAWSLMMATPPLNKARKLDEKAGRNAIRKDIGRIATILSEQQFEEAWAVSGGQPVQKAWKTKAGAVVGTESTNWITSPDQFAPIHQKARRPSDGRVSMAGARSRNIGRWKFVDRAVMTPSTYAAYLDKVYAKIGSLAAGWLPALRYFAARDKIVEGRTVASKLPPSFVARHAGSGSFVDAVKASGGGYASGTQNWRFGAASKMQSLLAFVMRKIERDMNGMLEKRLSKHVRDANTGLVTYRAN